eukprot:1102166-Pleurochrysis_carterae.AAC.1
MHHAEGNGVRSAVCPMPCPKRFPVAAVFSSLAGINKHPSLHIVEHLRQGPLLCRQPVFDAR